MRIIIHHHKFSSYFRIFPRPEPRGRPCLWVRTFGTAAILTHEKWRNRFFARRMCLFFLTAICTKFLLRYWKGFFQCPDAEVKYSQVDARKIFMGKWSCFSHFAYNRFLLFLLNLWVACQVFNSNCGSLGRIASVQNKVLLRDGVIRRSVLCGMQMFE